ncbi:hypothetical protein BJX99DRAFT_223186 [Aspergillus californicus]
MDLHGLPIRKRTMSVPISPSYISHIHQIDAQADNTARPFEGPVDVRLEIRSALKCLFHSLRVRHIDISGMVFERFRQVVYEKQTTTECRVLLQRFLKQPMQASNIELSKILPIRDVFDGRKLVTGTSNDQSHKFYPRSWIFSPSQLLLVVQLLRERGFNSVKLDEWEFQSCIAAYGTLTVRYIGMIKGRRDFIQRSQLDISEKSPQSLFGAFRDIVKAKLPIVHDRLEIHEFSQIALSLLGPNENVGNQLVADDTERLLIQLFGEKSLLNTQSGGQYVDYLPKMADEGIFRSFDTRYFGSFSRTCARFPRIHWRDLSNNFSDIETRPNTQ